MNNQNKNDEIYYKIMTQNLVKNILKLFKKTDKYQKYQVLSIVADLISKKEVMKNGFDFSNTMFRTAKRKINDEEIEDIIKFKPESKIKKIN